MSFKVGDEVRWCSQAQGSSKQKQGRVIEVVPAGEIPNDIGGVSSPRNHESYVVHVGSTLYWPRVSHLKMASGEVGTRYRFVRDEDGHNYLIRADKLEQFHKWVEATCNEEYDTYDGEDFSGNMVGGSVTQYTFENPVPES